MEKGFFAINSFYESIIFYLWDETIHVIDKTMRLISSFILFLFLFPLAHAQQSDTGILRSILAHYYKNEKPVYKGRSQLLYFYCDKPNNNEEIFETINKMDLPKSEIIKIRHAVNSDTGAESWQPALDELFQTDNSNLKIKINNCLSVEQYHEKRKVLNLNNQRLMIVSKPIFYGTGNLALVKVVFYRSIEHNSGSVLLMEKTDEQWTVRDFLNPWST